MLTAIGSLIYLCWKNWKAVFRTKDLGEVRVGVNDSNAKPGCYFLSMIFISMV